jgi:oxygen-dependent protoporphyrinogen oxidase
MTDERFDVAVVGAGITGLTAAFHLARGGAEVVVLEAADRVGGVIESRPLERPEGSWLFEIGPNTVLESRPAVAELIAAAGLADERVEADPAAKRRYVWKDERLVPLPSGAASFLTTPLFSVGAKLRLLAEPFVGRAPADREETIADFVRRRLGSQFLDYAVGPFVSGVYAGDPDRLSVRWAVSRIHDLEVQYGGLLRGMLAKGREARRARQAAAKEDAAATAASGGGPAGPGGAMVTFAAGLDVLPRRLAEQAGDVRTSTPVTALARADGTWVLETAAGTLRASKVVITTPADATAALLDEASGGDSRPFAEVPYAPVVVATLGVRREHVDHPLDGFGFLAPRRESLRLLGCLFTSSFYPGRAPQGHAALTAFAGGRTDPRAVELSDDRLYTLFLDDLGRSVGLTGEPVVRELVRWPRAIPQYELGHGRYVELAAELERRLPGLALASNVVGGVSVPDRIQRGAETAARLLAEP